MKYQKIYILIIFIDPFYFNLRLLGSLMSFVVFLRISAESSRIITAYIKRHALVSLITFVRDGLSHKNKPIF